MYCASPPTTSLSVLMCSHIICFILFFSRNKRQEFHGDYVPTAKIAVFSDSCYLLNYGIDFGLWEMELYADGRCKHNYDQQSMKSRPRPENIC